MLHPRLTRYQLLVTATIIAAVLVYIFAPVAVRWWLLTVLCALSGLCVGLGVSFPQWQMFGQNFCRGMTQKKIVALTFDDGPDPENTPALLALFAERNARATFFCIGNRVANQPELVKRIVAEGHAVENHTFRHNPMSNIFSVARLREELTLAQTEIHRVTGRAPIFFRPPVGLTNPRIFRVTRGLGLSVAGYTARGLDRRNDTPEKIAGRLLARLQPGAIFLLHDAGYRCVRLDELKNEHETNH